MRELKFRVYDSNQKKLVYFDLHNVIVPDRLLCQYDCPVQQFTGLLDAGGREIYEGDIITFSRLFEKERKIKELVSYVKFQDAKFGFDLIGFNDMFYDLSDESSPIVIGNIFENSGLLKRV